MRAVGVVLMKLWMKPAAREHRPFAGILGNLPARRIPLVNVIPAPPQNRD
jgi:hypothetical protein